MENDGGQLFEEESAYIYEKEDLVTLRPGRDHAWLDNLLERLLRIIRCRPVEVSPRFSPKQTTLFFTKLMRAIDRVLFFGKYAILPCPLYLNRH